MFFFLLLKGKSDLRAAPLCIELAAFDLVVKFTVVILIDCKLFPTLQTDFFVFAFVLFSVCSVIILHPADCGQYVFIKPAHSNALRCVQLAGYLPKPDCVVIFVEIIQLLRDILRAFWAVFAFVSPL